MAGADGEESRGLSTPTSTNTHRVRNSLVYGGSSKSIPALAVTATAWKLRHPELCRGSIRCQEREVVEKGHGRSNANHGLANEGEDGKKGHGLGIKVQHVDLIMGKHCVEEGGERRN